MHYAGELDSATVAEVEESVGGRKDGHQKRTERGRRSGKAGRDEREEDVQVCVCVELMRKGLCVWR